ncbi:MAG TPA: hypothetical protein VE954_06500 [Oligoflexus sp.]|uniref:hypothetical protein n=1 Tax=Oligoflexus sp. TaxID=1971216 RepID=UPI002D64E57F|nr:hypothetical protein [Oligoflexus sp.]HYX32746.1 hypothetical protein [Oligoflexus sp.]
MNIRSIFLLASCFGCLQSCGKNQESEAEKAEKRRQEAYQAYKELYTFDINSEKSACDEAKEVAVDFQITIESCSWKDSSIMELSISKGDHKHTKTLRTIPDFKQDYDLTSDVVHNDIAMFLVSMTQIIRYSQNP